jgi:hypothetical protein
MNRIYAFLTLVASSIILLSNSANPPNGKTGAPGDGLCSQCHAQSNPPINGQISVEGFPAAITPGQAYVLTVVNRNNVGDAVEGGFQMTILGPLNTKVGTMANPSANAVISNANNRQYFEHSPSVVYPDSNVIRWTVEWTAPALPAGTEITWYAAGNITNGNNKESGDRVVTANGKGTIVLSATENLTSEKPTLYPNPGADRINIILHDGTLPDGQGYFYSVTGARVGQAAIQQGMLDTPPLPPGVYILEIRQGDTSHFVRWSKI